MAIKFVLMKNAEGQYQFVLKAKNGGVIATSETFATKAAAKAGVKSVKKNAAKAPTEDETAAKAGAEVQKSAAKASSDEGATAKAGVSAQKSVAKASTNDVTAE